MLIRSLPCTIKRMPPRKAVMTPEALRKIIARSGLKQKEFAERLKVHPITVTRWVKGNTPISAATAALIRERFPS